MKPEFPQSKRYILSLLVMVLWVVTLCIGIGIYLLKYETDDPFDLFKFFTPFAVAEIAIYKVMESWKPSGQAGEDRKVLEGAMSTVNRLVDQKTSTVG